MLKKIGLTFLGLLALTAVSYAGGAFQGYPLVGGNGTSNCLSFGNNGVCNQYQPAGPSGLTGNETIPADTNIQGGGSNANPSTVNVPILLLGGGATQYSVPTAGGTVAVNAGTTNVVLDPAGTLATLTVTLPAATSLTDGQRLRLASSQTITALTVTAGSGTTIAQNPTALTVSTTASYGYEFVYVASATKWIRLQ